ncbi:ribosomal protein L23 [Ceratobasidium sp. AG-Ba]|nr:ribosomal protein L23 [Ceratobasidium sp. AG-Ba]
MNLPGLFSRFYSTGALPPKAASSALVSSTPRAVRIRRNRFPELLNEAKEGSALSDVEQTTYNRLKARGELTIEGPDGPRELSEDEWLERTNAKRRRVRGTKQISANPESEGTSLEDVQVVGQRIYLPNITFLLVRNHTPPGEPYNPFEATFRVPQSLTKLDIRGYLLSMYGVRTTYIRTDNRMADIRRGRLTAKSGRLDSATDTYKRAVVGLEEPFYFPQTQEDMDEKEREERKLYMNRKFQIDETKKAMGEFKMRAFREIQYRNKGGEVNLRGKIIRRVMERRMAREGAVANAVEDMLADTSVSGRLPTVRTT